MNWSEQLKQLRDNLLALGPRRLAVLGLVGLAVFSAVGLSSYYLSRPDFETLYAGLEPQDAARIGAALQESGISFDVNPEGTAVLVHPGQASRARMLLAEKGLPSSASAGYELFDKMGAIGLTSFMQEITRVRALEGEISRTIQGMKGVRAARVHIVMADTGSFRRSTQKPSASVVIRADSTSEFNSSQAIRHLVAAAVPGLTVDQVRVLSTDGTVLAGGEGAFNAAPTKMLELERTVANELKQNVSQTLAPYIGIDNFQISVAARLNIDKRQINETTYDPNSRFERSRRTIKEKSNARDAGNSQPVGVEQNIPAEQPQTGGDSSSARASERKEELKNFEANSKVMSTVSDGYRIDALTVAVVLNRKRLEMLLGEGATPEAIASKLKEVENIVASATGADTERGDRITVAAVEFMPHGEMLEPLPGPGVMDFLMGEMGTFIKALAVLGAAMILVWFGLRPATRMLLEYQPIAAPAAVASVTSDLPFEPQIAPAFSSDFGSGNMAFAGGGMPFGMDDGEPDLIGDLTSKINRNPQKRLEQIIDYDEDQAVTIMKQWLRGSVTT
ncbi:flagellar basal-body MS-ring/collar protein FliF [Hyphomicrobium sp. D-2]|uniref:flagellar basal-body MS-ring/collar protein FliF n=1 Tax=Hyphomicrobium sp. D-2 TaxID=3041621 RepID=UPI0024563EF7|nr:flagellar basal-body MS-ring/collar protein FliF [Hyphomicrobium sp. D-2]MDH4983659.1 flagellar basal-body MS-ring/collar protein FliF [Hyphomicrobium sp. D-2]